MSFTDETGRSSNGTPTPANLDYDRFMARYLFDKCNKAMWLEGRMEDDTRLGVLFESSAGGHVTEPSGLDSKVVDAAERLHFKAALTFSSPLSERLLQQASPLEKELIIGHAGVSLPIVDSVQGLTPAHEKAFMCLCRKERYILLWCDSVQSLLSHGQYVESALMDVGMNSSRTQSVNRRQFSPYLTPYMSRPGSLAPYSRRNSIEAKSAGGYSSSSDPVLNEKLAAIQVAIAKETAGRDAFDPRVESLETPKRPFLLTHAAIIGLAIGLVVVVEMACIAKLIQETRYDGGYLRWTLICAIPVFTGFSLFFMIVIVGSLFQLFGPLSGVSGNSTYYSSQPPKPGRHSGLELPHITIQMPVYKEGLKGVIIPSVDSVKAAIRRYEEQGGTASIYVNEDGMQLVDPEIAEARKAFYELNNIGWCARPAHCTEEGPRHFIRAGRFKKASNMNYCLDFSLRVEDEMNSRIEAACLEKGCSRDELPEDEEERLYNEARDAVCEQDEGRTWAGGDVRIGEIILIIDSDTRVPVDCLLYGALEMEESPEVALIQHASGILQVAHNAFENGITYFTNLIYTSIQFAVGCGDCAPFVGHNTFIRWKALQSISMEQDGTTKFWSDSHVSEDFDVSLRLQMAGFVIRLATYHDGGFKEGVSLTVYDELARWEKYAYGCNELVFNPIVKWPTKGPLTRLFMRFLWSNIKVTSKVTILAYIGTYYAIASAVPLTLVNYIVEGLIIDNVDQFYVTSWKIFVGMAVVFNILSPLAFAMLRHRLGQKKFFPAVWECIKWTPMFVLFFGGLSFHLFKAIFCHFFSIKMEWTTTAKELEASGFRAGLDRVVRDFKWMYLFFVFPVAAGMIFMSGYAPPGWNIRDFSAIVPLANQVACHALLPFALGLF